VNAPNVNPGVYLDAYLRPLAKWLEQGDVTDILINAPGEVWIERLGGAALRHEAPATRHSDSCDGPPGR
jgi:type IV secretion system protein VirB11